MRTDLTSIVDVVDKATAWDAIAAKNAEIERLRLVFDAAYGLCMGYDWNNGTAAKYCGYRRKLLGAVNAIKPVPDFEEKYRGSTLSNGDAT